MPEDRPVFHDGAAATCEVLGALLAHGGKAPTSDVASRAGVHRDQARRILQELEARGWAYKDVSAGTDCWALGPALPRIGLTWLERLSARARELRAEFDAATEPIGANR